MALDGLIAKARGADARTGSRSQPGGGCDAARQAGGESAGRISPQISHRGVAPAGRGVGRGDAKPCWTAPPCSACRVPWRLTNDLLVRGPAGAVKLIPVAHPDHPLAKIGKVTSHPGARSCAAGADRPLHPDRGPRFGRGGGEKLAAGRSGRQACAAAGGAGLGIDAQTDGVGRSSSADGWSACRSMPGTMSNTASTPSIAATRRLGPAASWLMERLAMER